MKVRLDSKRRITLPPSLVSAKPGQVYDALYDSDEGTLILRSTGSKDDWLDVLAACPVPMDDIQDRSATPPKGLKSALEHKATASR